MICKIRIISEKHTVLLFNQFFTKSLSSVRQDLSEGNQLPLPSQSLYG